jgi:hypothetical protein
MHGVAFLAYAEQVVMPTLEAGEIIAMDNLPAHKSAAVRHAIEAAGVGLRFLPPDNLTSIRSRWHSPSSRPTSRRLRQGALMTSGTLPPLALTPSRQSNDKTTSLPQDITENDRKVL